MNLFTSILRGREAAASHVDAPRRQWLMAAAACCVGGVWPINPARAASPEVQRHLEAAKAAAGTDLVSYLRLADPLMPGYKPERLDLAALINRPGPPPAKAFDNLYFLGSHWVSAWAITTSDGILLIDALNNDEEGERLIVGGMKQLGLDPTQIRTVLVTHGHGDHYGAANDLKRRFKSRIAMSDSDWSMTETKLEFDNVLWGRPPKRDIIVRDGDTLRLGDATLDVVVTPGHTMGTVSPVFTVRDGSQTHKVMLWGGTGFNFGTKPERMKQYVEATDRARRIAREKGVDVFISNHSSYDRAVDKFAAMQPGRPNPFVMGPEAVQRALTVMNECAQATLASWTT
jgi:metallo-beta-lactamase class B